MSAPRPVFGPKERRAANDAQLLEFFRGYDRSWRLAKLVLTRSLMRDRARLQPDLQAALGPAFSCDEQYIYGPVTSGLLFSAIAELMMLAEDLFALLRHIRSRERFANAIVHYDAGKVTSVAGQLKTATLARLASAFMVPTMATMGEAARSITAEYGEAVARLALFARRASDLFDRYSFLFGQYKHGLTAALRPFGRWGFMLGGSADAEIGVGPGLGGQVGGGVYEGSGGAGLWGGTGVSTWVVGAEASVGWFLRW